MPYDEPARLFHQAHYNILAKQFRIHAANYLSPESGFSRGESVAATTVLTLLMADMAKRFHEDNPDFDPVVWMDHCSPNVDRFPFGELYDN